MLGKELENIFYDINKIKPCTRIFKKWYNKNNMKKLYRSNTNKVFAGIIGGIGEYLDVDPVLLRVLWLLILAATGVFPGLIVYIIAIFIVPKRPANVQEN